MSQYLKTRDTYTDLLFKTRILSREFEPDHETEHDTQELTSEMRRLVSSPRLCEEGQ